MKQFILFVVGFILFPAIYSQTEKIDWNVDLDFLDFTKGIDPVYEWIKEQ